MTWFTTGARGRLALSAGVVALAAALAGLSTWATFTDSTQGTHSIATGTVDIDVGTAGTADNRLDVAVGAMAPGDSAERALTLHNSSTLALSGIAVSTSASTSSLLDTDSTNGLRMAIDRCSVAWTETPLANGGYSYACSGTTSTVLAERALAMSAQPLTNVDLAPGGGIVRLRIRTRLPTSAGNAFQGLATSFDMSFTATQRNATNR